MNTPPGDPSTSLPASSFPGPPLSSLPASSPSLPAPQPSAAEPRRQRPRRAARGLRLDRTPRLDSQPAPFSFAAPAAPVTAEAHPLVAMYRDVLRRARQRGSRPDEGHALFDLGRVLLQSGAPRLALGPLQEAVSLYHQVNDRDSEGQSHELIALCHRSLGDLSAARAAGRVALAIAEETVNGELCCTRLALQASLCLAEERPREALPLLQQAVAQAEALRLDGLWASQLVVLGQVLGTLGELAESQRCFERALPALRRLGMVNLELTARAQLALAILHSGRTEEGIRQLSEVASALRAAGQWLQLLSVADNLALALQRAQPDKARRWLEEALELHRMLGVQRGRGLLLLRIGGVYYRAGDRRKARLAFEEALPQLEQEGYAEEAIMTRGNLGLVLMDLGSPKMAFALMEEAVIKAKEAGHHSLSATVQANLGLAYFQAGRRLESRRHLLESAMGLDGHADQRLVTNVRTALGHLGTLPPMPAGMA